MAVRKKKEPEPKSRLAWNIFKFLLAFGVVIGLAGGIVGGFLLYYIFRSDDSDLEIDVESFTMNFTSIVYAKDPDTGQQMELERLFSGQNRIWINYEDLPENLVDAFISIEDERFRSHHGVDWKRTLGAFLDWARGKDSYGGSTITQQLIKNMTGEKDKSPTRKLKEIGRAIRLEKKLTKDQLLELYLNTIPLGGTLNGVQTAANRYFDKDASELSLAECASIAAITQYPSKYNPFLNPDENQKRQKIILKKMLDLHRISEDEYEDAIAEKLDFQKEKAVAEQESFQSYFVDEVINQVLADLVAKGYQKPMATQLLYSGGLSIHATVDLGVQTAMDKVFQDPESFPTLKGNVDPETGEAIQPESAMAIVDPETGAVLGLVGGRGQKTSDRVLNRATQSRRQPGSAIKPLSTYGPALEYDVITYGSVYDDAPMQYPGDPEGHAAYWPYNQNRKFSGLMTVEKGVAQSINTIAARVLSDLTVQKSFEFMTQKLGIHLVESEKRADGQIYSDLFYSSLALGGLTDGVTCLEMASAYATFANKGIHIKPYVYTEVYDHDGNLLLENKPEKNIAMSESSTFILNKLLVNAVQTGTGTPARLKSGQPVAGKTGTTTDEKDRWFAGYTPYYSGVVWFGYDQPKPMRNLSPNPAAVAWKAVMEELHKGKDIKNFPDAQGVVTASYCIDSGLRPGEYCSHDPRGSRVATGWFKTGTAPTETCNRHTPITICSDSLQIAGEFCPESQHRQGVLLAYERPDWDIEIGDDRYMLKFDEAGMPVLNPTPVPMNPDGTPGRPEDFPPNRLCGVHTEPIKPETPEFPEFPHFPDIIPPWLSGDGTTPKDPGKEPSGGNDSDEDDDHTKPPSWLLH